MPPNICECVKTFQRGRNKDNWQPFASAVFCALSLSHSLFPRDADAANGPSDGKRLCRLMLQKQL